MKNPSAFLVHMAAAAFAVMSGCTAFGPAPRDLTPACTGMLNDGIACTADFCPSTGGPHLHFPTDAACAAGQMCDATRGCVARDPSCPATCDDGIRCTADSCVSGACRNSPDDSACFADEVCVPTRGCEEECMGGCDDGIECTADRCVSGACRHLPDDTACDGLEVCEPSETSDPSGCWAPPDGPPPPPPVGRLCPDGQLIGERIRLSFADMSGIRTFAGGTFAGDMGAMLYSSFGSPHPTFGRVLEEDVTVGGTLNVHPFEGNSLSFDSRMANLQSVSSPTNDVSCEERGITLEAERDGRWVTVTGFCWFGWDTQAGARWGESDDPLIPTGDRIGRVLVNLDCQAQDMVYVPETGTYRPAR